MKKVDLLNYILRHNNLLIQTRVVSLHSNIWTVHRGRLTEPILMMEQIDNNNEWRFSFKSQKLSYKQALTILMKNKVKRK